LNHPSKPASLHKRFINQWTRSRLPENWIDEAERRTWFLFEATRVREE
jgi:hypothetical protein